MTSRIDNLKKRLPDTVAVVLNAHNRYYLTDFRSSAGALIILPDKSYFLTDSRYIEMAKKTVLNCEVCEAVDLVKEIGKLFDKNGITRCMMEDIITVRQASKFKLALEKVEIDTSSTLNDAILACREIKDDVEISYIEMAQDITDTAFELTLKELKIGMSEWEVKLVLEGHMRRLGAEDIAFDTIAVSGENSSLPHGVPGERLLQNGDFLTLDFGAKYRGYCTDITRTVAIGAVDEEHIKVYNIVKRAQSEALRALAPGKLCNTVDAVARDIIKNEGYGDYFGHGLGHSLGIEIHEEPRLSPLCKKEVVKGMILTVEPGIYLPGKFGVRIEDSCVVTDDGARPLSRITKELIVV